MPASGAIPFGMKRIVRFIRKNGTGLGCNMATAAANLIQATSITASAGSLRLPSEERDAQGMEPSPKFGATYRLNDDVIVCASYSEGFHSGGFFGVNQNIRDFQRDQYDPEFAESWEMGLKSMWLDNRLRFNVSAFLNDFTDKQVTFVKLDNDTKTVATVFENAASVTYKGVEAEVMFAATENLRLFVNYGYLDAKYDEFKLDISPTDDIDNVVDATFLKPRNAAEYTLGYGFVFNRQIGPGELEVFAKLSESGNQETDVLNLSSGRLAAVRTTT